MTFKASFLVPFVVLETNQTNRVFVVFSHLQLFWTFFVFRAKIQKIGEKLFAPSNVFVPLPTAMHVL